MIHKEAKVYISRCPCPVNDTILPHPTFANSRYRALEADFSTIARTDQLSRYWEILLLTSQLAKALKQGETPS